MAYTCSLLLRTLPAIDAELNPPDEEPQIIFDLPRPRRDYDISPERAMVDRMAPCCATTPVEHALATNSVSQLLCGRDHRKFRCMRCNLPGNPACNRVVGCI